MKRTKSAAPAPEAFERILNFYDCALREGSSVQKLSEAMEISVSYMRHLLDKPEYKLALQMAEKRRGQRDTLSGYVFSRLSKEAQAVWEKIQAYDQSSQHDLVDQLLDGHKTEIRQELFVHALVHSSFDASTACRMVRIPRTTLESWRQNDLHFRQLMEEIQWHKKNFFERSLIDLVEEHHPGAVLFVNRTVNADRGYTEKLELSQNNNGANNGAIDFDTLELDLDTRKKILDAIRLQQAKKLQAPKQNFPQLPAPRGNAEKNGKQGETIEV